MEYIIAILIVIVLFGVYAISYIFNERVNTPENCKEISCVSCNLNCNKRSDNNAN